jgi:hypothetical protein
LTLAKEDYLAYLIVARQCLKILLAETELPKSTFQDLFRSSVVSVKEILSLGDRALANGNTCLKLATALVRMGNFDETGEDVSLPCFVQGMVEVLDVSLKEPQFSLEADGVGLKLCDLVLDAVIGGFQSKLGGVVFLSPSKVSFNGHDGKHKERRAIRENTRISSSSSDQDASEERIDAS